MKHLGLFILTITMLYNTKVLAAPTEFSLASLQNTEAELQKISFNTTRPLREISNNIARYQTLLQLFTDFRELDLQMSRDLLKKIENNSTLTGDDLYKVRKSFDLLVKLNKKILEAAEIYEYPKVKMADTYAKLDQQNPMARAHLIYLTANLAVFDHIRKIHALLFAQDGSLRRIIKSALDDPRSQTLKIIASQIADISELIEEKDFRGQINLVRAIAPELKTVFKTDAHTLEMITDLMESDTSEQIASGVSKFEISNYQLADSIIGFFNKLTNTLSEVFGNIAGSISWRKGYLQNSQTAIELLTADLQPMDLLLEKSPFILTDKFIPGHFGHAAIYLGTREQLERIGMWEHPDIVTYHDDIINGRIILEAVRSGVRLATLESFLNIDEVTVVRKEEALSSPHTVFEQIKRGMDQIGKAYDFNFDISTLDKIVCSELIYIVFGNVNWPTRYRLGRATVTPDDLAEIIFMKNSRFKVKNYLISTKRHRIDIGTTKTLAPHYDYE